MNIIKKYYQNIIFISIGIIQTILALFLFDRADDHSAFLEVARYATNEAGTISDDAVFLFHILAYPIVTIFDSEFLLVLWFRFLSLLGFIFAYRAVASILNQPYDLKSRSTYFTLILMCPDMLAWTSSLLRDGVAILFWSLAIIHLSSSAKLRAMIYLICGIILRPQNSILLIYFYVNYYLFRIFNKRIYNIILFASILITLIFGFEYRKSFEPLILKAGIYGYPFIDNLMDFYGFFMVFSQILLEPINVYNRTGVKLFEILSCLYFVIVIILFIYINNKKTNKKDLWFSYSIIYTLFSFGYFEYFISGFSRHRIFPLTLMLAYICINFKRKNEI